jgi:Flp pilus assembly protein TadD
MVYERRGELALARRQYEAALALEPEHEEAKKALRNLGDSAAR